MAEAARGRVETPSSPVARIVSAYLAAAEGDAHHALHAAVGDALTDICEAERRCGERDRLISAGYVRAAPPPRV